MKIQEEIGHCFSSSSCKEIQKQLKKIGYRFPNIRAQYIRETQIHKNYLPNIIKNLDSEDLREWLVQNIKGVGYKEASHFLRNIGYDDYAIIDFHIIDILVQYEYIEKPKSLTKKRYLEIEQDLKHIAKLCNLTLAELDFYLWYLETGKILK